MAAEDWEKLGCFENLPLTKKEFYFLARQRERRSTTEGLQPRRDKCRSPGRRRCRHFCFLERYFDIKGGRYLPVRIALLSSPGCAKMYARISSVVIPSTPGAPLLLSTRLSAVSRFSVLSIASSVIPVKAGGVCAVFSMSITVVAPS